MENREVNFIGSIDSNVSSEELKELYDYGLTSIRLNMSYRLDYYDEVVNIVKRTNEKYGINIKLICDLAGTEMRVVCNKPIIIKVGQEIVIGRDFTFDQGDLSLLQSGDEMVIKDGEIILVVNKYENGFLYCTSKSNNVINKNANAYNSKIYERLPFISDKDRLNLNDAIRYNADFIAVSHVRNKKNLDEVREYLKNNGVNIKLISKIENKESLKNLDEVIENSDGIMIARGDLGKILPIYDLGYNQKIITEKTLKAGKYLISATDYLASLIGTTIPMRSEIIDLFSAYNDGIRNIMFSKELSLSVDKINFLNVANNVYKSYLKYKSRGKYDD